MDFHKLMNKPTILYVWGMYWNLRNSLSYNKEQLFKNNIGHWSSASSKFEYYLEIPTGPLRDVVKVRNGDVFPVRTAKVSCALCCTQHAAQGRLLGARPLFAVLTVPVTTGSTSCGLQATLPPGRSWGFPELRLRTLLAISLSKVSSEEPDHTP